MNIKIPADVMAAVTATHERKMAEAQQVIAESLRTKFDLGNYVDRRRIVGFFITVEHSDDVADEHIAAACAIADDYFGDDERIDWSAFFDRLDLIFRLCVVDDECGAAQRIQRAVREHRKAGN